MTRYGFDPARRTMMASWPSGGRGGDLATMVAELDPSVTDSDALQLSCELAALSAAAWALYSDLDRGIIDDPASKAGQQMIDRGRLARAAAAVRNPNLPDEDGYLLVEYSPLDEYAHRLGRVLHRIGSAALTGVLAAEVEADAEAVLAACRGERSGRAAQAVALAAANPIPAQVAKADQLLEEDLFTRLPLFELDAGSSAVAAARWLYAAAHVAGEVTRLSPASVLYEVNLPESCPARIPATVVAKLDADYEPFYLVTDLIDEARAVGQGKAFDNAQLGAVYQGAVEFAARYNADLEEVEIRLCLLDPARPGLDLLEDLLTGILGCFHIYERFSPQRVGPGARPGAAGGAGSDRDSEHLDDASLDDGRLDASRCDVERRKAHLQAAFVEEVRAWARKRPMVCRPWADRGSGR